MTPTTAALAVTLGLSLCLSTVRGADPSGSLDPKEVLESIPKDLLKQISGNATQRKEAIDAAEQKLREKYRDQTGTLTLRVRNTNKSNGRYYAYSDQERVRLSGTNFSVGFSIYFSEGENEKAAKLKPGDKITASGRIFANLYGNTDGDYTSLSISLSDAKLK